MRVSSLTKPSPWVLLNLRYSPSLKGDGSKAGDSSSERHLYVENVILFQ
jgi:hypothetical protein